MVEEWRDIIIEKGGVTYNFTGKYQVSNEGRVKNIETGNILKPTKTRYGYLRIKLYKDGKLQQFVLHRLVASAFIPNPDNLECVNHINEIKTDNRVENLEWCTRAYNTSYSQKGRPKKGKLKRRKIICVETGQIFNSVDEVVEELRRNFTEDMKHGCQSISKWIISECCRKKQSMLYNFKDYHFMYLDDYENQ